MPEGRVEDEESVIDGLCVKVKEALACRSIELAGSWVCPALYKGVALRKSDVPLAPSSPDGLLQAGCTITALSSILM